jgi:hypothetical protein
LTPKQKYRYRKGSTSGADNCNRCKQYQARRVPGGAPAWAGHCLMMDIRDVPNGRHNAVKADMTCNEFVEDWTKLPDIVRNMRRKEG